jgi:hypothetical protein
MSEFQIEDQLERRALNLTQCFIFKKYVLYS